MSTYKHELVKVLSLTKSTDQLLLEVEAHNQKFEGIIKQQDLFFFNEIQPFSLLHLQWLIQRNNSNILTYHPPRRLHILLATLQPSDKGIYLEVDLKLKQNNSAENVTSFALNRLSDIQHMLKNVITKVYRKLQQNKEIFQKMQQINHLKLGVQTMVSQLDQVNNQQQELQHTTGLRLNKNESKILKIQSQISSILQMITKLYRQVQGIQQSQYEASRMTEDIKGKELEISVFEIKKSEEKK